MLPDGLRCEIDGRSERGHPDASRRTSHTAVFAFNAWFTIALVGHRCCCINAAARAVGRDEQHCGATYFCGATAAGAVARRPAAKIRTVTADHDVYIY